MALGNLVYGLGCMIQSFGCPRSQSQVSIHCLVRKLQGQLGLQVWEGRQIGADPNDPTWQKLSRTHRSSSAAPSDQDELGGSRTLRPRQRVTLTSVLDLPSGEGLLLFTFSRDAC